MTEEIKPLSPSAPSIAPKTSPDQQQQTPNQNTSKKEQKKQGDEQEKRPKKGLFDEFV